MSKLTIVLCTTVVLGAASFLSVAGAVETPAPVNTEAAPAMKIPAIPLKVQSATSQAEESQTSQVQNTAPQADPYSVTSFIADFKHYAPGSVVPERYRTKQYTITDWKTRNLPAPEANSHWTYMGGNYVLITDDSGKILQAKAGTIFYKP